MREKHYFNVMFMQKCTRNLIFIFSLSSLGTELSADTAQKSSESQVPIVMYDFLGGLMSLQPFMVSSKKFQDPKNEKEIKKRLSDFIKNTKRLSHSQRLSTASFQISAHAFQEHLTGVLDIFNRGRKEYARRMLNATMDGCSSCHTQVPSNKMPMWKFRANEIQGSNFEKAEFLFTVRHYDEALDHYNSLISQYQAKTGNKDSLETALKRKLAIYIRAKQSPKDGVKSLEKDLHNKNLPKVLKTEIKGWIDALKKISEKEDPSVSAENLENFASTAIPPLLTAAAQYKPGSYVIFLYTSGLIFHFINTHKESEVTPGLLYWLAICDNHLSQTYFFSLTDLYLKECIKRFPRSSTANKCYNELESMTIDSYTGSSGTNLPEDVLEELQKYKKMLKRGT